MFQLSVAPLQSLLHVLLLKCFRSNECLWKVSYSVRVYFLFCSTNPGQKVGLVLLAWEHALILMCFVWCVSVCAGVFASFQCCLPGRILWCRYLCKYSHVVLECSCTCPNPAPFIPPTVNRPADTLLFLLLAFIFIFFHLSIINCVKRLSHMINK